MIGQIRNKFGNQLRVVGYIGVLAVALIALSVPADAAFAAEPDQEEVKNLLTQLNEASDPKAAFAQLTPEQQTTVDKALTDTIIEVSEEVYEESATYRDSEASASAGDTCKTHKVSIVNKTRLGAKVWTYYSRTRWCYDGRVITSKPYLTRGKSVHMMGWEFVGHTDKSESGGKGDWVHEDYTEGHFRYCLQIGSGCGINHYPDITKTQYGNGDYDSDWSY